MNGLVHWNLKKAIKECLKDKKKYLLHILSYEHKQK